MIIRISIILATILVSASVVGEDLNKLIGTPQSKVNVTIECSVAISLAIENYKDSAKISDNGLKQMKNEFSSILCLERENEIVVVLLPQTRPNRFIKGGDIVYSFDKHNLSLIKRRFGR